MLLSQRKRIVILSLLGLVSVVTLTGCGKKTLEHRAQLYHDTIVSYADPAYSSYNEYTLFSQETSLEDLSLIQEKRLKTITLLELTLDQITALDSFEGDSTLQEAVMRDLSTLLTLLQDDELELIGLWQIMRDANPQKVTPEAMDKLREHQTKIFTQINEQISQSDHLLTVVQQKFIKEYGLTSTEETSTE